MLELAQCNGGSVGFGQVGGLMGFLETLMRVLIERDRHTKGWRTEGLRPGHCAGAGAVQRWRRRLQPGGVPFEGTIHLMVGRQRNLQLVPQS